MTIAERIPLVHGPTPIVRRASLDALVGAEIWIKRDDATGGAESGNKIRKLEYLFGDALAKSSKTILTCGGLQSNHARATALVAAQLGLRCVLFLRVADPKAAAEASPPAVGNVLLDRLAGAEIRFISPDEYRDRMGVMARAAESLDGAYVIPEGGSNGLGSLGYVDAMAEVKAQSNEPFDVVAHACGSGGTAAGVALGIAKHGVATNAWAFAVCDDRTYFERTVARIAEEAQDLDPSLPHAMPIIDDRAKGPAYAIMNDEQKKFVVEVARASGVVLDPVYTGKALYGVQQAVNRGDIARGARLLFIHTGGLPGLLAQGEELHAALG
jgi:D-cysteine desulfhydrase